MSSANEVTIAYKVAGAAVTTWKTLRRTNDTLTSGVSTVVSDTIRSDRKMGGSKVVSQQAGGTVDFELSATDYDDIMEAAFMSTWSTNVLKVGVTTVKLDFIKRDPNTGMNAFFGACQVSMFSLDVQAGSKITGQFSIAADTFNDSYAITTDTFAPAGANLFMDSSNNFGSLKIDGTAVTTMCFTGTTLSLDNSMQQDQCLGSLIQANHKGSAKITGGVTIRSSTAAFTLWKQTMTNVPITIEYKLTDGTKSYTVVIDAAHLSGDLPSGGLDAILSFSLDYTAAAKANGDYVSITRTV